MSTAKGKFQQTLPEAGAGSRQGLAPGRCKDCAGVLEAIKGEGGLRYARTERVLILLQKHTARASLGAKSTTRHVLNPSTSLRFPRIGSVRPRLPPLPPFLLGR